MEDKREKNEELREPKIVSSSVLAFRLKNNWTYQNRLFILDCRTNEERKKCRIIGSLDVNVPPTILLKRLLKDTLPLSFIISTKEDGERFRKFHKTAQNVILMRKDGCQNDFSRILHDKLSDIGCDVSYLKGGVAKFLNEYHDLRSTSDFSQIENESFKESCSSSTLRISRMSNMKLDDLHCSSASSSGHSGHHRRIMLAPLEQPSMESTKEYAANYSEINHSKPHLYKCRFPVQIIPYLYLGNAECSSDLDSLRKNGIKYILNVTPDLPNTFEKDENFKYMQIPVDDHWSQNLTEHFPQAFKFIDEARLQCVGVLVHCWAGISRSVTVTVAYLMRTLNLSMDDAYDRVKSHKPNIAPNFSFMGQLLDYERDLYGGNTPKNQNQSTSPSSPIVQSSSSNDDEPEENFLPNSLPESSATAACC